MAQANRDDVTRINIPDSEVWNELLAMSAWGVPLTIKRKVKVLQYQKVGSQGRRRCAVLGS